MRNKKQTDQEKKRLPLSSDFGELAPGCQRSTKREQIDEKRDRVDEFVLCESVRVCCVCVIIYVEKMLI